MSVDFVVRYSWRVHKFLQSECKMYKIKRGQKRTKNQKRRDAVYMRERTERWARLAQYEERYGKS